MGVQEAIAMVLMAFSVNWAIDLYFRAFLIPELGVASCTPSFTFYTPLLTRKDLYASVNVCKRLVIFDSDGFSRSHFVPPYLEVVRYLFYV